MSQISDFLAPAIDDLHVYTGSPTFTWGPVGVEIPCVPSGLDRGQVAVIGAKQVIIRLTLIVKLSNFVTFDSTIVTMDSQLYTMDNNTPHPVAGQNLIFEGVTYSIASARKAAGSGHYALQCVDKNFSMSR